MSAPERPAAFVTRSVRRAWEETGRAGASTLEARGLVAEEWLLRLCDALSIPKKAILDRRRLT